MNKRINVRSQCNYKFNFLAIFLGAAVATRALLMVLLRRHALRVASPVSKFTEN